mmetsp:Transcript_19186/g.32362  ORF Transcript_19186/g.32362 Transcript_19186/m.32362 type:complete len:93 (+) Transcript_19186:799-1077(+)
MEANKLEANFVRFVAALPLTGEKAHDGSIIKARKDRSTVADVIIVVVTIVTLGVLCNSLYGLSRLYRGNVTQCYHPEVIVIVIVVIVTEHKI